MVTSNFSFSQHVFYPSQVKFQFLSRIHSVVCKCFLDQSKSLLSGQELTLYQEFQLLTTLNPLPNNKFSDSSKLKVFADYNFKFDENGRNFSKRVENTVGKGEITRNEQFLLFPQ